MLALSSSRAWVRDVSGLVFMLVCGYVFAAVAGVLSDKHTQPGDDEMILRDALFDRLPHVDVDGNDKAEMVFLAIAIPVLFVEGKLQIAARQTYIIQAILWILRAPAFLVTRIPNPYQKCVIDLAFLESRSSALLGLKVLQGKLHTCSDVMFSGHTAGLTMFFLLTLKHLRSVHWRFYFFFHFAAALLFMLSSHFHYSVDVYIGFLVAALVCIIYFVLSDEAKASVAKEKKSNAVITSFLRWYEQDL